MLAVISPAKTLDYDSSCPSHCPTQPAFLTEASELVAVLKAKTQPQLRELMTISEKLADENLERYKAWSQPFTEDNARAALFAFKGDVYSGFETSAYGKSELRYAQKHLRILSGLYGVLRPLDLMQPYRLEMGTQLENASGKNLYTFWAGRLTENINKSLKSSGSNTFVNLASNEYFSALQQDDIKGEIITPQFKDLKNGVYKFITFYGKKARGMMCDFMIRNEVRTTDDLKQFNAAGYRFNNELSEGPNWVFTRDKVPVS
ncbi:MAG: peroxide stress protein YaaA [Verrucomicrobiales bacterium]|nr:peroxide stress protein YaaA [Verrucomicrobiales bacterium]